MKLTKKLSRIAATVLALALLVCTAAVPAMAATVNVGGTGGQVTFTTTLDTTAATGASLPNATISYEIVAGDPVAATADTPAILAGVMTPTIAATTFAPDGSNELTATVDFSNVTFTAPGIYRYEITASENDPDIEVSAAGAVRYLDVYVTNANGGGLEISEYFLLSSAAGLEVDNGQVQYVGGAEAKSAGFAYTYTTYQLTLDKVVTGSMGDKGKEFDFTINFTGGTENETITYGGQTYTFEAGGTLSITGIKLADATAVATVTGIPSHVSYEVVENISNTEGYTTTATIDTQPVNVTDSASAQTLETKVMGTSSHAVVVTNDRTTSDMPATGVIMDVAPYALMVVVAVVAGVVFLGKRRED